MTPAKLLAVRAESARALAEILSYCVGRVITALDPDEPDFAQVRLAFSEAQQAARLGAELCAEVPR